MAAIVHMVCGGPGAGKTFFAIQLSRSELGVRFSLDNWMEAVYWRGTPPPIEWPQELSEACERLILDTSLQVLTAGSPAILDLGLMALTQRTRVAAFFAIRDFPVHLHVLHCPRNRRWARTATRNADQGETFAFVVTRDMFDFAERMWEPPAPQEVARSRYQRTVHHDCGPQGE